MKNLFIAALLAPLAESAVVTQTEEPPKWTIQQVGHFKRDLQGFKLDSETSPLVTFHKGDMAFYQVIQTACARMHDHGDKYYSKGHYNLFAMAELVANANIETWDEDRLKHNMRTGHALAIGVSRTIQNHYGTSEADSWNLAIQELGCMYAL